MCLIVFAYNYHPDYRLILAANRDEFYPRATRPMQFWTDQPALLAGQDLEQGGTWLGISRNGRFSALTNYRDGRNRNQGQRSRGFLPLEFLQSRLSCKQFIDSIQIEEFDGFNQLIDDGSDLYYLSNRTEPRPVFPGIHGLSNALLNSPWPKLESRKSALQEIIDHSSPDPDALIRLMADPQTYPDHLLPDTGISQAWERQLSASFIHMENYGTRATTALLQKHDGSIEIVEQNYDINGATERNSFRLQLPAAED